MAMQITQDSFQLIAGKLNFQIIGLKRVALKQRLTES